MIIKERSPFYDDMITLDVMFEQIRSWVRYRDLTKKELIEFMRKIQAKADHIERCTKAAGWDYFGGKEE